MKKTYDPEIDELIEKLCNSWDAGPDAWTNKRVVDANIAYQAAEKICEMYERLSSFEAEDYNQQMSG